MQNPNLLALYPPGAVAYLSGENEYAGIKGTVSFYETREGVLVKAELSGLPSPDSSEKSPIFAFHIHEGTSCTGNQEDPFEHAMGHFNPSQTLHPYHAGDLPPIFGNRGYAFSMFLTDRFRLFEVIGKTVILHSGPDDFTTQPSGNPGTKIACGVISPFTI